MGEQAEALENERMIRIMAAVNSGARILFRAQLQIVGSPIFLGFWMAKDQGVESLFNATNIDTLGILIWLKILSQNGAHP